MFSKKTVHDINLENKTVLLRADYNVPVERGRIHDDYRIRQSLPTLHFLLDKKCKVIICSHLGRPDGKVNQEYSLEPVRRRLSKLLERDILFAEDCIGQVAEQAAQDLQPRQVLLLENLRFHPEEEDNNDSFAQQLASLAEIFVQDGFGVVHRAHASTDAITRHLPSVAGLLLEKEVDTITNVMDNPKRPLAAIIGGAKISDKIDVLSKFIDIADFVAVGGAMANTFLLAEGIFVGKSLAQKEEIPLAKDIIARASKKARSEHFVFYIPQDGVVASKIDKSARTRIVDWDAHVIASVENYPRRPSREDLRLDANEYILDIGPFSGAFIAGGLQLSNTVVWNGAMGVTETDGLQGPVGPFAHGTETIMEAMAGQFGHKPYSLAGGGDTVGYIEERKITSYFNHISTGGGASIELMSGKKLPGIEMLLDKSEG